MEINGLILGTRWLHAGRPAKSFSILDRVGHIPDNRTVGHILSNVSGHGIQGLLTLGEAPVLEALAQGGRHIPPDIYPIIPNVLGYVREATDYGTIGAGLRRLRRLSLWRLLVIGMRSVRRAPALWSRDFASMIDILFELEMADFLRFRPRVVFLHGQITDLALAVGNKRILSLFADRMRRRYHVEPGLATYNFGTLVPQLRTWGIEIRTIHTPFHPNGFLMYPSRRDCEDVLEAESAESLAVVAEMRSVHGPPDETVFEYLCQRCITALSFDSTDPEELDKVVRAAHTVGWNHISG